MTCFHRWAECQRKGNCANGASRQSLPSELILENSSLCPLPNAPYLPRAGPCPELPKMHPWLTIPPRRSCMCLKRFVLRAFVLRTFRT